MKVKHLGPGLYGGRDYDGTDISAVEGAVLLVTERRAEKLLADSRIVVHDEVQG